MSPPEDHREIRRGPWSILPTVTGMSDAIVYADAEGVIRLWNRGATRVFGFTKAEGLGCSLDIIILKVCVSGIGAAIGPPCVTWQSRYGRRCIRRAPPLGIL